MGKVVTSGGLAVRGRRRRFESNCSKGQILSNDL